MKHFTYLITHLNENNIGETVKHIAGHARENAVYMIEVDIEHGGRVLINTDWMEMTAQWRCTEFSREYFTLEAALHDGVEFARGECPEQDGE